MNSRLSASTDLKTLRDPEPLVSPAIPPCEKKFNMKSPCFDFLWSGNDSLRVRKIVTSILRNNPGRLIPARKVMSFRTPNEVDDWLFNNPMRCPGALHFVDRNDTVISYGIQTNSTAVAKRWHFEDAIFKFQIPFQLAAEREIASFFIRDPNFSWDVGLKKFAQPPSEIASAVRALGPTFFLAIAMFGFVFQIGTLVTEKELKLRQVMTMMGLYDSAYWLSWLMWEGILVLLSSLFIILFGMMFQFDFFLNNSFAVLLLLFFLFELNMIGFAFMLSVFISKSSSATTVGYSIFMVGCITQFVTAVGFPYKDGFPKKYRIMWSFFPPNLLAQALQILSRATSTPQDNGISWSARAECSPKDPGCVIAINDIYKWLMATFFLWCILAIYLDNTVPNVAGVRKSVFYFLRPGYWTGKGGNKLEEGSIFNCIGSELPLEHITADDEDVLEEENIVKQQSREGIVDPDVSVQIRGLVKTYPKTVTIGCCKTKKTSPYHAVKGLWLNIAKDQLFCLLGPNGAGKTTTISCLTGIAPVTNGDDMLSALIYGNSIRSCMAEIQKYIGVCPQFDILWDALSGEEHLQLFANIKGIPPDSIKSVAENSLAKVKLSKAAKTRAGSYSGGMKRRLSVSIALIGDPKLVILDEPTTGMDPISRRHVWDVIQDAKKGRAIILTTHSMEEADILSDRIAIMAKGRLRCIGTSIRLKSKFGSGFIVTLNFTGSNNGPGEDADTTPHHDALKQFFKYRLNVLPKEENKAFLTYVISQEGEEHLKNFFAELEDREEEFGIADIQVAVAEGTLFTLNLTSGASVEIPAGARFVGVPETQSAENPRGIMVEVFWEQDDSGALCISDHSPEMPIPPHLQLNCSSTPGPGPVRGIVIDPSEIGREHHYL